MQWHTEGMRGAHEADNLPPLPLPAAACCVSIKGGQSVNQPILTAGCGRSEGRGGAISARHFLLPCTVPPRGRLRTGRGSCACAHPANVKCNRDTRKPDCWISEGGRVWRKKGAGRICTHASVAVATTEINVIRVKSQFLNEKRRAENGSEWGKTTPRYLEGCPVLKRKLN